MKFNWGHGITIFIIIFLLATGFFVYKSFQEDYPLVEGEYYPKGLEYDKQRERIENVAKLTEKFKIEQTADAVKVIRPDAVKTGFEAGNYMFYRASGENGDYQDTLKADTTTVYTILKSKLLKGRYTLKLNWKASGKEFYQEEPVYIN